jgi:hypothetical protein
VPWTPSSVPVRPSLTYGETRKEGGVKKALLILTVIGILVFVAWKMMEETE